MKRKAASKQKSKTATRFKPDVLARALVNAIRDAGKGERPCASWTSFSALRIALDVTEDDWSAALALGVSKGWLEVGTELPPKKVCVGSKAPKADG